MKREAMENDRDAWLGPMMRAQFTTAADPCVDAETLAAWAEGTLDAKQVAAVELHASNCPHCMAALASLERTTPAVDESTLAPSRASFWRWLVPLTAAAAAVAIWIAVPDRPFTTQAPSAPAPASQEELAQPQARPNEAPVEQPATPPPAVAAPEPVTPSAEPSDLSKRAEAPPPAPEPAPRRADERREAARETFSAPAPPAPRAVAPPPAAAPPAARPQAPAAGAAADSASETAAATLQRQAPAEAVPTSESPTLTNALIRWRVMGWTSVERSIDGGKTWIRTTPPPGVSANNTPAFSVSVVSVRAVDAMRATVTTSDGREFYTTNGGLTWERLQGNSPAPF